MIEYSKILSDKNLKITPQRISVLEAFEYLQHPTAELIINFVTKKYPHIAIGTIYKTLETFVENGIIKKITTEKDVMRYDSILEKHHHLYCTECDKIEDYYDEDLNQIIENHLKNKNIPNFNIKNFVLQINGTFNNC